jgi:eukaryotic-like serine/threonine-protein kinase
MKICPACQLKYTDADARCLVDNTVLEQLADERIGTLLGGRYLIERQLGEGGMAVVYRARNALVDRPVAVKIMNAQLSRDPSLKERFRREAKNAASIAHPNIIEIHDHGETDDGTPFLVMELLRGMPLVHRMSRGRLPVEQAAPIVHDLLVALGAAHSAGVVHRDLKPENVFLERVEGATVRVKLLDLGIARVVDAAGGAARRTRTGALLGTPGYMSPEHVENVKNTDARSDLWAAGVLLYEMLTGRRAFEADNEFARMILVLSEGPEPIETVAPQYAHWAPFFEKALARAPSERFQDAAEMALALLAVAREGQMPGSRFDAIRLSDLPPGRPSLGGLTPASGGGTLMTDASRAALESSGTAVSRVGPASPTEPRPNVEIVKPRPRGVPVSWAVAAVAVALGVGLVVGFLAGRW